MSFYATPETRQARTGHWCSVCVRRIERGERYTVQKSHQDGWVTWRTCTHCEAALQTAINLRLLDDKYDGEMLFDALAEHSVATARLAVGIRRKWLAFCGPGLLPIPDVTPRRAPTSYTWCARHNAERIERVGRQLADLAASFGGSDD